MKHDAPTCTGCGEPLLSERERNVENHRAVMEVRDLVEKMLRKASWQTLTPELATERANNIAAAIGGEYWLTAKDSEPAGPVDFNDERIK